MTSLSTSEIVNTLTLVDDAPPMVLTLLDGSDARSLALPGGTDRVLLVPASDSTNILSALAQGPAGPAGGASVVLQFLVPSLAWQINHNLDRYPVPIFFDTDDAKIEVDWTYVDRNTILATFTRPTNGTVYIT